MGIGLTASSAASFKMNRLPGEFQNEQETLFSPTDKLIHVLSLNYCVLNLLFTYDFISRLGQAIVRISRG